jgi:hypothetical protein
MWDVYWVGVFLGLGVGLGIAFAGLIGGGRWGLAAAALLGAAAGAGLGFGFGGIEDAIAGGVGGVVGAVGTQRLLSGTLRRGGTRGAAAAILLGVSVLVAVLAFVPLVGFLEGAVLPALAARMRQREPSRYAGLRTLARD